MKFVSDFETQSTKKRGAPNTPKGLCITPKFRTNSEQTPRGAFELCCSDKKIILFLKKILNQKKIICIS